MCGHDGVSSSSKTPIQLRTFVKRKPYAFVYVQNSVRKRIKREFAVVQNVSRKTTKGDLSRLLSRSHNS